MRSDACTIKKSEISVLTVKSFYWVHENDSVFTLSIQ